MSRFFLAMCRLPVLIAIVSTAIAAAPGPRQAAIADRQETSHRGDCVMAAGAGSIRFHATRMRMPDLQAMERLVDRRGEAKPAIHRATNEVEDGFLHWCGKAPPAMLIPTQIRSNPVIPARGTR